MRFRDKGAFNAPLSESATRHYPIQIFMKSIMLKYFSLTFTLVLALTLVACSGGDDEPVIAEDPSVIPTDLSLIIEVVGASTENPNGDGSGVIKCQANAKNAVNYGFKFAGGDEVMSSNGSVEFSSIEKGTKEFIVTVAAYSRTNHKIKENQS